ncbi:MAG: flavodoxin family protein [Eubacteriales bacterium]|nr:flavodoxin family protein [Eubacteriales bacterium]
MKKIIALVGSRAGAKSHTKELCEKLIHELGQGLKEELSAEIITADRWHINGCLSCGCCFKEGLCAQDKKDDMAAIKEKLLSADIILLASPVFAANISGDMKTLIDRLSLWLHIMPLIGKIGIPVCTASSNHANRVIDYLKEMLEYMGASAPVSAAAYVDFGDVLMGDENNLKSYLKEKAGIVQQQIKSGLSFTEKQERVFGLQNAKFKKQLQFLELYPSFQHTFGEAVQWNRLGYDKYDSIHEIASQTFITKSGRDQYSIW